MFTIQAKVSSWVLAIVSAVIMLQTLYFKFTAAPESVHLFSSIGMEPLGRLGVGALELIASILILIPTYRFWGALLGLGLMAGALFFHFTVIGIVDNSGNYLLFAYAITTFVSCAILIVIHRGVGFRLFNRKG